MAHAFDTGLPRAQRTSLRSGVVTLLAGLRAPAGYLQAVIPWGGRVRGGGYIDDDGIDQLWSALAGRAPSIAVALGSARTKAAGIGGFSFVSDLELSLYFLSNHPRDGELGRLAIDVVGLASDTADPGLDVMMEHAAELLIGQRPVLGPTVKQIVPESEEELRTENGFTLWSQRYSVTMTRAINAHRTATEMLDELHAKARTVDMDPDPATPVVELRNFPNVP